MWFNFWLFYTPIYAHTVSSRVYYYFWVNYWSPNPATLVKKVCTHILFYWEQKIQDYYCSHLTPFTNTTHHTTCTATPKSWLTTHMLSAYIMSSSNVKAAWYIQYEQLPWTGSFGLIYKDQLSITLIWSWLLCVLVGAEARADGAPPGG